MFDMGEQYFKGVLAGYLGANFMCGPITEWQIDIIKENISHYCEATIDHSQLSYQEKEDQKRQMKQSLEVYIQGVKDEMRGMGRMRLNNGFLNGNAKRFTKSINFETYGISC